MRISKSKFVAGCQCVKRLYWQVHEPELGAEPDAADQAIMRQGHEVGMLARQLFPGGIEVRSDRGLDQAICATRELVANSAVSAIFEGVFQNDGMHPTALGDQVIAMALLGKLRRDVCASAHSAAYKDKW